MWVDMSKASEMYVPEAFALILIRSIPQGGFNLLPYGFCFSGGLDGEASSEGVDYLGDGLEAGVAVLAEALVEAFAAHSRVLGDLGHASGLGDVAERRLLLSRAIAGKPHLPRLSARHHAITLYACETAKGAQEWEPADIAVADTFPV